MPRQYTKRRTGGGTVAAGFTRRAPSQYHPALRKRAGPTMSTTSHKSIALWLLVCCALVFAMVVVGGVTRLTRSGLSIVEWAPILGALPPLNLERWQAVFDMYKQTPEYQKVNVGMSLDEFKGIYWMEYAHRLLGRAIGLVFLLPFVYFLVRGRIDRPLVPKLTAMFVLGGLQGALGWYMVASGLVDDPHVSPYRLTAHLGLAVLIYGFTLWTALDLLFPRHGAAAAWPRRGADVVAGLVFVMILSGGFVAGTKAGFAFNTFPTMNGQWLPPGAFALTPWWQNLFENIATVQFTHRLLALVVALTVAGFWLAARRHAAGAPARLALHALLAALAAQIALGIATLVHVVPIPLAAAHQAGAVVLFSAALFTAHAVRRPPN